METFWIPKFKFSFLNTRKLNFNNYVKTCLEIFSFPLNILCINNWNETNNGTIILFCYIVFPPRDKYWKALNNNCYNSNNVFFLYQDVYGTFINDVTRIGYLKVRGGGVVFSWHKSGNSLNVGRLWYRVCICRSAVEWAFGKIKFVLPC